jgi:predicted nucleotidyltransferase component of viral defense system
VIPPLPPARTLADACRVHAGRLGLDPMPVEKDFHLTRLIWALAERFGDRLLLKGGTCLSKCDVGFRRMSEDADFVLPGGPGRRHRGSNAARTNAVAKALREIGDEIGMSLENFDGDGHERRSHVIWTMTYPATFPPGTLLVEASMRHVVRPPRKVALRQVLAGRVAAGYADAYCWALDADEVRAEKVRAAFTRAPRAIRDFYDLGLFAERSDDMTSDAFVALVDEKLAEADARPLAAQHRGFGLTQDERAALHRAVPTQLTPVLRRGETFDLDGVIACYDRLWEKIVD